MKHTTRKGAPCEPLRERQADAGQSQHREPIDGTEQADGNKQGLYD